MFTPTLPDNSDVDVETQVKHDPLGLQSKSLQKKESPQIKFDAT